jgi:hypothetical protein
MNDLHARAGGGAIVLCTYVALWFYLKHPRRTPYTKSMIIGPLKYALAWWVVFSLGTAALSVWLAVELTDQGSASDAAFFVFLTSMALWAPLVVLDAHMDYDNDCILAALWVCMVATPCAWLVFFIDGPSPSAAALTAFAWTFSHHALVDSWWWFEHYLCKRTPQAP